MFSCFYEYIVQAQMSAFQEEDFKQAFHQLVLNFGALATSPKDNAVSVQCVWRNFHVFEIEINAKILASIADTTIDFLCTRFTAEFFIQIISTTFAGIVVW